jgi:hypothetical protein
MFLERITFNQLPIGHLSEAEKHAKGISVIVPLLFHLRRQIAKRNGGVVKEKNASERGRKRTGESGNIDVHKVLRMMRLVSVTVIAGRDAVGQEAENVAKLGHQPQGHAAPSQVMKTSGWKNLHPLAPLSPLFPPLCRPRTFHHRLSPEMPKEVLSTMTRLTMKLVHSQY